MMFRQSCRAEPHNSPQLRLDLFHAGYEIFFSIKCCSMTAPDALQILVISHAEGAESGDFPRGRDYVETIRNSFIRQETHELVRELSLVDEQGTGAAVRRFYVSGKDPGMLLPPEASELAHALHTLVVLLVTTPLVNDDAVVTRMAEIARAV